jgi:4-hydroxy-4-methyl-2-oxoglutarate aldolase
MSSEHVSRLRHLGTSPLSWRNREVIVVEQRTDVEAGCWGGIVSLGAKVKGLAGGERTLEIYNF